MTLEELYYFSQIVASIAILASLIYAALQFRVYAAAAREARYTTAVSDLQEFRKILATDADCARIYRDGLADLSKLDSLEQALRRADAARRDELRLRDQIRRRDRGGAAADGGGANHASSRRPRMVDEGAVHGRRRDPRRG